MSTIITDSDEYHSCDDNEHNKTSNRKEYDKQYNKMYYSKNKNKWKEKKVCDLCKGKYIYGNKWKHYNTKKHKRADQSITNNIIKA